jgi:tRNA(Ile)-lysidine synthase
VSVAGERLVGLVRASLPEGQVIGVAVSGGGDSIALLHLVARAGMAVQAVTVDHALRPESADEAAGVAAVCADLGVLHAVLRWDHGPVMGNLMDAARRARLALIGDWARARGIGHVALGHTQDDQAETLLMGLARQAGLPGLAGMRPAWQEGGVTFHRPLLSVGRQELRAWLRAEAQAWVDDPTNADQRFQRVKARAALAALASLGISAAGLARVAGQLQSAQVALAAQVQAAAVRHVREVAGALQISPGLATEPAEVQRQLVERTVRWLTQAPYAPRAADLARFVAAITLGSDATLAGCRHRQGWVLREARALGGPVPVGELWDGRWRVIGQHAEVRALGAGLRACPNWRATGLPRAVLEVTPSVWQGETLLAAPLAGWPQGWSARLDAGPPLFGGTD